MKNKKNKPSIKTKQLSTNDEDSSNISDYDKENFKKIEELKLKALKSLNE
jgi:hypothetical protein